MLNMSIAPRSLFPPLIAFETMILTSLTIVVTSEYEFQGRVWKLADSLSNMKKIRKYSQASCLKTDARKLNDQNLINKLTLTSSRFFRKIENRTKCVVHADHADAALGCTHSIHQLVFACMMSVASVSVSNFLKSSLNPKGSLSISNRTDPASVLTIVKKSRSLHSRTTCFKMRTKRLKTGSQIQQSSDHAEELVRMTEHAINYVLKMYHARGVMQADNFLDAIFRSNVNNHQRSLRDLQQIFHAEMGVAALPRESGTNKSQLENKVVNLHQAITCWSQAIRLHQTNRPEEAQKAAKRLLAFTQSQVYMSALPSKIPPRWIEEATVLCAPAANSIMKPNSAKELLSTKGKWNKLMSDSETPLAVKDLLSMLGMEYIKEEFINIYERHRLTEKQDKRTYWFNARFEGKPGTGKRTVAHHYAALLRQLNILPKNSVLVELSGASLSSAGIGELQATLSNLKVVNGGAILIYDTCCLTENIRGQQVLHYLLSLAKNKTTRYGDIVWIIAGNAQELQKVIDQSPALIHRFPNRFIFNDFTNDELMQIFEQLLTLPTVEKKVWVNNSDYKRMIDYKGDSWYSRNDIVWYDEVGSSMTSRPLKSVSEYCDYVRWIETPDEKAWILEIDGSEWICSDGTRLKDYPSSFLYANSSYVEKRGIQSPRKRRKHAKEDEVQCSTSLNAVEWFMDGEVWRDAYGGLCTHHPTEGFGDGKPLLTQDGRKWTQQPKLWWRQHLSAGNYSFNPSLDWAKANERPKSFRCEGMQYVRMAIHRLGKRRSGASFGNARAVQDYYSAVRARQAARVCAESDQGKSPDIYLLTKDDLLGPQVRSEGIRRGSTYRKLQALEGLIKVKQAVDALIDLVAVNAQREEEGKPLLDVVLNRVFLGNPGTGKTTVARLYGQLLAEMGLLSKGYVVLKTASDFIGNVLGSSEAKTRNILRAAEGCVLVIDEAYGLYSGDGSIIGNNPYNAAVINTIVEQVQAEPGEDRAVILLGYRSEMERMLRNANPGLARRFQLENAFEFPDYSDVELLRILLTKAKASGLSIDIHVAKRAVALLAKARAKPNFGNAGAIENMLSEAKTKLTVGESELTLQAFGMSDKGCVDLELDDLLGDIVGCVSIKNYLTELRDTVAFSRSRGDDPRNHVDYHFLFLGNPGTGKTTIARRMGRIFYALGLLPEDRLTEVSAADLVTGYVGQAGKRTRDILESSRGGVLFIDEAYQLDPKRGGRYMTEVVDELVRCVTIDILMKSTVVILAGYTKPMVEMLKVNRGLASRFTEKITFENLDSDSIMKLLVVKLREKYLEIEDGLEEEIGHLASKLATNENFANGRDVASWSNAVFREFSKSQMNSHDRERPNSWHAFDATKSAKVTLQQLRKALVCI